MPRPRRQLKNAILVDATGVVESKQVWYTPAALARHLGRSRTWVCVQAKTRPLYAPCKSDIDGLLYHETQVALIDAVIAGNRTEADAEEVWQMKCKLIGVVNEGVLA